MDILLSQDSLNFEKSFWIRLLIIPIILILGPFDHLFRVIRTKSLGFDSHPIQLKWTQR